MSIYWLSEKHGLQIKDKIIIKQSGAEAPPLPDGLPSDLLAHLKKQGLIGAKPAASENVIINPEVKQLQDQIKKLQSENDELINDLGKRIDEVEWLTEMVGELNKKLAEKPEDPGEKPKRGGSKKK